MTETTTQPHDTTVIIVSYNTRELTIKAIETLLQNAGAVSMRVIVWDNASHDGSADAVAQQFPDIELIRSTDNIGFARANNAVAEMADTEWLILLNPDTETYPRAIENLVNFGRKHPEAGIVGGRTVFPDGSLNIASCWNTMTLWSLFCSATGLTRVFRDTTFFNPEGIGGWKRDSVRHVDVVVGCFLLIRTALWRELGGFNERYFMYGEEHDLCLRAAKLGCRPMITPDAQIMHLVGASSNKREDKVLRVLQSKVTLVRDHWSKPRARLGIGLLWLWIANRRLGAWFKSRVTGKSDQETSWHNIWKKRGEWLRGY
ncbi:glycosyl transferase family 2 [Novosphingobium sp. AAP83]|uniref:glycosyltransferase family 2 protein n=1 Tax=Novosphingobium sp. AAP83 TaxID=1523425 RepID=UPI0006B8B8CA|nr:glycosyltransferase family 2 protein [Novosphingobium sp. AAP83]KPF93999.1 glycosyl transferase family 2 [Novosphingobium sp. AAP83]